MIFAWPHIEARMLSPFWHRRASIEGNPGLPECVHAMIAGNANTTSSLIPAGPRKAGPTDRAVHRRKG